jgi:hypothetical protein
MYMGSPQLGGIAQDRAGRFRSAGGFLCEFVVLDDQVREADLVAVRVPEREKSNGNSASRRSTKARKIRTISAWQVSAVSLPSGSQKAALPDLM